MTSSIPVTSVTSRAPHEANTAAEQCELWPSGALGAAAVFSEALTLALTPGTAACPQLCCLQQRQGSWHIQSQQEPTGERGGISSRAKGNQQGGMRARGAHPALLCCQYLKPLQIKLPQQQQGSICGRGLFPQEAHLHII